MNNIYKIKFHNVGEYTEMKSVVDSLEEVDDADVVVEEDPGTAGIGNGTYYQNFEAQDRFDVVCDENGFGEFIVKFKDELMPEIKESYEKGEELEIYWL